MISEKLSGGVRISLFNSLNPKNQGPTTISRLCGNRQKLLQNHVYKHFLRKSLRGAKNWLQMTFQLFVKNALNAMWYRKSYPGAYEYCCSTLWIPKIKVLRPLVASVEIGKNWHKITFISSPSFCSSLRNAYKSDFVAIFAHFHRGD